MPTEDFEMSNESRADFEAWWLIETGKDAKDYPNLSEKDWVAWQASRKVALEDAAKEFDERAEPNTGYYTPDEPAEIIRSLK
jgi:hypothetical protein